jgi:AAA15 family ATPase/GTPase
MSNLIQNIHIQNFKSVRDLQLDCARINVFIGKPNAGKSNILEAISLLGAGYSDNKFMNGLVRYETLSHFFSSGNIAEPIHITADGMVASLNRMEDEHFSFVLSPKGEPVVVDHTNKLLKDDYTISPFQCSVGYTGEIESRAFLNNRVSPIKKYHFNGITPYKDRALFLWPPHGDNLYSVVQNSEQLQEEIYLFLKPNGLDFLLDEATREMFVFRKQNRVYIKFPLNLVPDTFQRYIFHLAAIMSNRDSVLLFEEPESHSYAPYVYQLAQRILDDEGGNQYFITTHNPYLLTPILQEGKDVALFVTWFEDYQTRARRLSEKEVGDILNYGMDIFLNLKYFIPK